jgi:hypothetical protein
MGTLKNGILYKNHLDKITSNNFATTAKARALFAKMF